MPGMTPIYGITYPCGGEAIDVDALATFSRTLDAALVAGAAEMDAAANRPNAQIRYLIGSTQQTVVFNVATTVTYAFELYDNDAMADVVANPDRLVCQTGGVYAVSTSFSLSGMTTLTGCTIIITVNSVEVGRWKNRVITGGTFTECTLAMPVDLFPGDVVRTQVFWTGTGGPATISNNSMAASLLCTH